ncbi:hypothetical protein PTKU15_56290 [Paraburkholderia terrae]|nr:hypothetical protein PTKU15_56290 [Paraburkholderia terrae]
MLSAFDAAVVEPDSGFDPLAHRLPHTTWFAYASVGEVLPSRSYYADLPKSWLAGHNEAWASRVIDQSQPEWPAFFVEHVIKPLWDKGYRGFFSTRWIRGNSLRRRTKHALGRYKDWPM